MPRPRLAARAVLWPVVLLTAALLLPGCLVAPPRMAIEVSAGLVRAESAGRARQTAVLLEQLVPRVRALLPDTRSQPVEVWVQRELAVYRGWPVREEVPAFTIEDERRIHLVESEGFELSTSLSHELVHALLGSSWRTLPPVAEEGLADWVQERLNPDVAASLRADHLAKAGAAFGGLAFGIWSSWTPEDGPLAEFRFPAGRGEIDPHVALTGRGGSPASWRPYAVSVSDPRLYGIGYLVVTRIAEREGIERLHALCVQATRAGLRQVPPEWLLEAADLQGGPDVWRAAIAERVGWGELSALARSLTVEVSEVLAHQVRPQFPQFSGIAFLRQERPRLAVAGSSVGGVPLWRLPGLYSALRTLWPAPSQSAAR